MASIPIIKQTDATKELQFKLYASKFPVWWTHNSIDKPDPTYFDHLNDDENPDGFNWIEVPFTFNFKDQFTGSLVVDDQYYTFFKLVDSKDEKFPNKYYIVEDLRKAFNGGYELSVRLDVFVTYGLDFWVNGVKNPDINTKTIALNRTNQQPLLIKYYYNYELDSNGNYSIMPWNNQEYSNWSYLDPLLKFDSMPDFAILAQWFGRNANDQYTIPRTYINNKYILTWNTDHYDQTTQNLNTFYNLVGSNVSFNTMSLSSVRYYVFKPVNENDQYWLIWNINPREWLVSDWPTENMAGVNAGSGSAGTVGFRTDYHAINQTFISSTRGFANKLVGVFDGPPLNSIGAFSLQNIGADYYYTNYETCIMRVDNVNFLCTKVYITPDRTTGLVVNWPTYSSNPYFSLLSITDPQNKQRRDAPNTKYGSLNNQLFSSNYEIAYLTSGVNAVNNYYILQKAKFYNLTFSPNQPAGIGRKITWTEDVHTNTDNISGGLVQTELGRIDIPNTCFVTSSGIRLGTISSKLNLGTTLWVLPTSLPVATDEYANYMTSALINQNNSMAIAKQTRDIGIVDAVAGGVTGLAGAAASGGVGGIIGGISSLFNMGSNIAKAQLAYQNKQKTYDAQNAAARATMGVNINSSVDADTASQIMSSSLIPFFVTKYQWIYNFNWSIPVKLPAIENDILHYNNIVYLNGFYVNCQIKISELLLDWSNYFPLNKGIMPHLYFDFDIPQELIKFHFKTLNTELLGAITMLFNNGIRFWANLPDYSKPWYWLPGDNGVAQANPEKLSDPHMGTYSPSDFSIGGGTATVPFNNSWGGGGYSGGMGGMR